jgi:predicted DCC family thiol-disulfide oxidoreductase YuxK
VLYDADCGFCRWSLRRLLAWDRRGALEPVAIQSVEGQRLLAPLEAERRLDSWHVVLPAGEVFSAGAAAPVACEVLPGGRTLARLFRAFPGATDRAYRLIASNRGPLARLLRIGDPGGADR